MKSTYKHLILAGLTIVGSIIACSNVKNEPKNPISEIEEVIPTKEPSEAFKKYWYAGTAELTSYKLEQARYGEIHSGKAVLIYVTEDFNADKQVKADYPNESNIPILKLNSTKKFNTGIYPYSVMTSAFYPVSNNAHAIKITSSMQEWCGHVFTQLNNKSGFDIQSYSYFESESDQKFSLDKTILENELWTQLRIDPKSLPTGKQQVIPAFEFCRMQHVPLKAYEAELTLTASTYTINYPKLDRKVTINFNQAFPYDVLGWTEVSKSGFGANAKTMTTKATKIKQLKSPYWSKNSVKDSILRKELSL